MSRISQLIKYVPGPDYAIIIEQIKVTKDLVYRERRVQILDYRIKQPCNKQILLIKVLWANHTHLEATWETKEDMKATYPHLLMR